jgi:hypothetical protein
MSIFGVKTEKD